MRFVKHWRLPILQALCGWFASPGHPPARLRHAALLRAGKTGADSLLRDIAIPQPFDIADFCGAVAKRRGRPIRLCPAIMHGRPFGLWIPLQSEDQIWYEQETSAWHQQHIILHEIGHILCNHAVENPRLRADYPYELVPSLQPGIFAGMRRDGYSGREEQEAEAFAKEVHRRIGVRGVDLPQSNNPRTAGFLARLSTLYDGGEDGWSEN